MLTESVIKYFSGVLVKRKVEADTKDKESRERSKQDHCLRWVLTRVELSKGVGM